MAETEREQMNRVSRWGWPISLLILPAIFWWQIAFAGRVLVGIDLFTYFYPLRDYTASMLATGQLPLWNPYLFLGAPLLANIQAGTFYPLNLLLTWLTAPTAINWSILIHLALAGLGVYVFARRTLGMSRPAAWVAGVIYALGGFLSAQAEHVNQLTISAWLPWLLLLLELSLQSKEGRWRLSHKWSVCLTLLIAACFLAGHTQAWYISLISLALYALGKSLHHAWERRVGGWKMALPAGWRILWRCALLLAVATTLALALSAAQLLPTLELSTLSIRQGGMDYREAVSFSLKPQLLLRAFLPGYGESVFSEYVAYVGWAGLLLALVGLCAGPRRRAWRVGIGFVLIGLFLAFGGYNPFYYVLLKVVPGFALFRAPARWLVLYALGIALLAGVGLDVWRSRRIWPAFRAWIRAHRRSVRAAMIALAALVVGVGVALWREWLESPSGLTLPGWGLALVVLAGLIALQSRLRKWTAPTAGLLTLLLIELFLAGRSLALASPTAWDAYSSLRTAPAHLLAMGSQVDRDGRPAEEAGAASPWVGDPTAHWGQGAPTYRFLSMSGIRFDPGDLGEINAIWGDTLTDKAIYDLIVAAKQKEVLAPNLPLLYRIASVDGYDGGVLPLKRYVTMQSLVLEPEDILPDGRLREQLERVPAARLLAMLNVEYVITDKVQDVWIDDTFYDLQFSAILSSDGPASLTFENPYNFVATEIGIISHLEESASIPDGERIATVSWIDANGRRQSRPLRAGVETSEGRYTESVAHAQALVGRHLPEDAETEQYVARLPLDAPGSPRELEVTWTGSAGRLIVSGVTLIDGRTGANRSLVASGQGRFRLVHSGDVKIYRNLDNLPRAYMVGKASNVADDESAIAFMRSTEFAPAQQVLLHDGSTQDYDWDAPARVDIISYTSTEVALRTESEKAGYLVLTDTYYPGWIATIDGEAAPIHRANVMFRAVVVPAGSHDVLFRYQPTSFRIGAIISVMTAGILLLVSVGWWTWRRRRATPGV